MMQVSIVQDSKQRSGANNYEFNKIREIHGKKGVCYIDKGAEKAQRHGKKGCSRSASQAQCRRLCCVEGGMHSSAIS